MAKETYVTKCFSDETNGVIGLYESFGWELISNNVSTTVQTGYDRAEAAENELTFTRDKDAPWYKEVYQLQQKYVELGTQIEIIEDGEPKRLEGGNKVGIYILTFFGLMLWIIPGVLVYSFYWFKEKKFKDWHKENDPVIDGLNKQRMEIAQQSKAIIDG